MCSDINFQLIGLEPPHQGRTLALTAGELIVGRADDAVIRLEDSGISSKHARLLVSPDRVVVHDTSRNGTFVDGSKISEPVTLAGGETLAFGRTPFRLERLGEPIPEAPFALVGLDGAFAGQSIPLGPDPITVGRTEASTLTLPDPLVSTNHASLTASADGVRIVDTSANGTFVDEHKIQQPTTLRGGEQLRFGPFRFRVERVGGPPDRPRRRPTTRRRVVVEERDAPGPRSLGRLLKPILLLGFLGMLGLIGYRLDRARKARQAGPAESAGVGQPEGGAADRSAEKQPPKAALGVLEQASLQAWQRVNQALAQQDVLTARAALAAFRVRLGDVGGRMKLDANALDKHIEDWIDAHYASSQKALYLALRKGDLARADGLITGLGKPGMEKLSERVAGLKRELAGYYPDLRALGIRERNQPMTAPPARYVLSGAKVWGGTLAVEDGGGEAQPGTAAGQPLLTWRIGLDQAYLIFTKVPRNITRYKTLRFRIKGRLPAGAFFCVQLSNPDVQQRLWKRVVPTGTLRQVELKLSEMNRTARFSPARVLIVSFFGIGCLGQQVQLSGVELDVRGSG